MFAVLGPLLLLLAAIGIYAVVAYAVSLRTTEIGVRLALGATTRRLIAQFVGENLVIVGLGALAGWLVAFAAASSCAGAARRGRLRRCARDSVAGRRARLLDSRPPRHTHLADGRVARGVSLPRA